MSTLDRGINSCALAASADRHCPISGAGAGGGRAERCGRPAVCGVGGEKGREREREREGGRERERSKVMVVTVTVVLHAASGERDKKGWWG